MIFSVVKPTFSVDQELGKLYILKIWKIIKKSVKKKFKPSFIFFPWLFYVLANFGQLSRTKISEKLGFTQVLGKKIQLSSHMAALTNIGWV